jgi:tellurite methyltransferase
VAVMSEADRHRWNARYRERPPEAVSPSSFLVSLAEQLPVRGRALDVAGAAGGNALFLAGRGLEVTLLDVSDVALAQARAAADAGGLAIATLAADLDVDALPPGPFVVITCFNFLDRRLFAEIASRLERGGLFLYTQPTIRNLERHPNPSARFLLDEGELPGLVKGLEIVEHREGWFEGRHEARLLARRR